MFLIFVNEVRVIIFMQHIVLICDGAVVCPLKELNGKTLLQVSNKPNIDYLSSKGTVGLAKMIPDGVSYGSEVFYISSFGYNPLNCYFGRAPLEIDGFNINYSGEDVLFRCDFITLTEPEEFEKKTLIDSGVKNLSKSEVKELIDFLNVNFGGKKFEFFCGQGFKNYMVWKKEKLNFNSLVSPCSLLNKKITNKVPNSGKLGPLFDLIMDSNKLLNNHRVNLNRLKLGLRAVNSIWLWGEGKKPSLESFFKKFGLKGSVISSCGLLQGMGRLIGLDLVKNLGDGLNFELYFNAVVSEMAKKRDYVYVHIGDTFGLGNLENGIKRLEKFDELLVKPLFRNLKLSGKDFKILIIFNFSSFLTYGSYFKNPVPFLIYNSRKEKKKRITNFSEESVARATKKPMEGFKLIKNFILE